MSVVNVKFISVEDGVEKRLISTKYLTVPGTGDIIEDPAGGYKYKVESVVHQNVFNDPGEHTVTVNLIRL
ncbi:hypothetical protein [Bacillus thuringiensis]|uniref:hypothetical protein n=1 Tax=Bacillus thuringiensis TaxID=1428 RepID=UPI000BF41C55|nr:hypothetical protein [Bacillus thuringiensis]PFV82351.1 hypothetical protein COL06_29220 [Bacillus thuringiensis]